MPSMESIKGSFVDMTSDERLAIIHRIQSSRLVAKAAPTKASAKVREKKSTLHKTLDGMSAEELESLMKKLRERRKG